LERTEGGQRGTEEGSKGWRTITTRPEPTAQHQPNAPIVPHREEEDVNRRLDRKMTDAFAQIWKIHKEKGVPVSR